MNNNKSLTVRFFFFFISLFYTSQLFAQLPSYTITELPVLSGATHTSVSDVTNDGRLAVGNSTVDGVSRTVVWNDGVLIDIGALMDSNITANYALRVNDNGRVIGNAINGSGLQSFTWDLSNGLTMTSLGDNMRSINNNNQIVGRSGDLEAPAIWNNDIPAELTGYEDPTETSNFLSISDINDLGQITATRASGSGPQSYAAMLGNSSGFTKLPSPPGVNNYHSRAINDNGQIIGFSLFNISARDSWLWGTDGTVINLGFSTRPPSNNTYYANASAADINNQGIVVGQSWHNNSQTDRAVRWDMTNGLIDLNDLVDDLTGWDYLWVASSISDSGYITGTGYKDDGTLGAFILTPSNLTPPPQPITPIIVDNNAECVGPLAAWIPINYDILFFIPGPGANWQQSSGLNNAYGSDYYQLASSDNDGTPEFQWTFEVPTTGTYEVDAWWPQDSNSTATANYVVTDESGDVLVTVPQNTNGGQWNSLGFYSFTAGTTYKVKVSAPVGEPVLADAIRVSN